MKVYNTLTRKKEEIKPIKLGRIGFYSCGPTVYNYAHIGNLRTYIFSDILKRCLIYSGYKVKHVMNITDVGHLTSDADDGKDKLEEGAQREGKNVWQIAKFYEKAFLKDIKDLNIIKPSKIVRATDTISIQIKLIKKIQKAGFAYETSNALYFDVEKFEEYGKLSGQDLDEKITCSRSEVVKDGEKRTAFDFVLWFKRKGKHKNHVMHWNSPWGDGFPGWHIECSAISSKYLGQPFDIHTGGEDHIGTHHENEIAQSEVANNTPLANIWMHSRHMIFDSKKMSKSLDNFITLSKLKEKGFDAFDFRYLCLTAHYRSQLNFSWQSMEQSQNSYNNLLDLVSDLINQKHIKGFSGLQYKKDFEESVKNDIDIPSALAVLWKMIKDESVSKKAKIKFIKDFDRVFGLNIFLRAKKILKQKFQIPKKIIELAKQRQKFREKKDFKKSDEIRLMLAEKGYEIEDKENSYIIIHSKKS